MISVMARAASAIAPGLTARWAERVFLTPGRVPPRPAELARLESGHPFRVPFADGYLAAWSWGDGPTVFLSHGWAFSAARMTSLVEPLLRNGFSVVAHDAPGHGQSDGTTSSVVEMAAALRAVVEWTAAADAGASHAGVIGHSIGGAAVALAMKLGLRFRKVVLIGSPASLAPSSHEGAARLGLSPAVISLMQDRIEKRLGVKWDQIAIEHLVPDPVVPLLLIHDAADPAIPVEDSARIARSWPGAERIITEGLGHNRILEDAEVVSRAAQFIATGALPVSVRPRTSGSHKRTAEREGSPVQRR